MARYESFETTAQRVYNYLKENYTGAPQFVSYTEIADAIGRTRSSVSYAVGVLLRANKIAILDGKIAVKF